MTLTTIAKTDDGRAPVAWGNYPGRVAFTPLRPVGPNTLGEYLWPVEVQYDAETNRSRVGHSFVEPRDA